MIGFSHRERSHHGFNDSVAGLDQAIVPVGVKGMCQFWALRLVYLRTWSCTASHWSCHCFNPLEDEKELQISWVKIKLKYLQTFNLTVNQKIFKWYNFTLFSWNASFIWKSFPFTYKLYLPCNVDIVLIVIIMLPFWVEV